MTLLPRLAWQDLAAGGYSLRVFCACLALGVTLVAATGGLYQQVSDGLQKETRELTGGDLEVQAAAALPAEVVEWMAGTGTVSLLTELNTMMAADGEQFQIVELQSVDANYPLYGKLTLSPQQSLAEITANTEGFWGIAVDPVLAERMSLNLGDMVDIGQITLAVRALITHQPDRSLSADWRGAPVIISAQALAATGLLLPSSRVDYAYRVRTNMDPVAWEAAFFDRFPDGDWEVQSFLDQGDRIAERLAQVASGLLIIGFSTLFIGGLGVFNSVQAYLQGKLGTIATLRALGLRDNRLARLYLLQIGIMAGISCLAGAALGFGISLIGAVFAASQIQVTTAAASALLPCLLAFVFGMLTAFTFSLPALGRALSVLPAVLFRNLDGARTGTPRQWWLAAAAGAALIGLLVLLVLPDPLFAISFIGALAGLLLLLEGIVRLIRRTALSIDQSPRVQGRFALRLAVANLHRHGSSLRASLLSLGSALTLLVACTLVVSALIDTIANTIPEESPALVMYDIAAHQRDEVEGILADAGATRLDFAPLVQGRLTSVNGQALRDSAERRHQQEARDEHKLTYRANNIDSVTMVRGAWWDDTAGSEGVALVAMEDREADQLGLVIGDQLVFDIAGQPLPAILTGIYRQKGLQTRFWFEAILSDGAMDPFISRYVGAGYLSPDQAVEAQTAIGQAAPNVVSIRTATLLATARELLGKAMFGLALVAGVALTVSLLVLTGIIATSRTRQVYDATVLHAIGTRLEVIRRSLTLEYALLAGVTSLFAIVLGTAIAVPLLVVQLRLPLDFPVWPGIATAVIVSSTCLYLGARQLLHRLTLSPATLLRSG
ncbi:MAG: ABC transporter permease [Pseudomonadota bacterium]